MLLDVHNRAEFHPEPVAIVPVVPKRFDLRRFSWVQPRLFGFESPAVSEAIVVHGVQRADSAQGETRPAPVRQSSQQRWCATGTSRRGTEKPQGAALYIAESGFRMRYGSRAVPGERLSESGRFAPFHPPKDGPGLLFSSISSLLSSRARQLHSTPGLLCMLCRQPSTTGTSVHRFPGWGQNVTQS